MFCWFTSPPKDDDSKWNLFYNYIRSIEDSTLFFMVNNALLYYLLRFMLRILKNMTMGIFASIPLQIVYICTLSIQSEYMQAKV